MDFVLLFLDFDSTFGDKVLDLVELVDVFGRLSHFPGDFFEFLRELGVAALCKTSNHVNLLLDDVAVLLGVHVTDVVAVDFEHRNRDAFRNTIEQDLLKTLVLIDVILNLLRRPSLVLRHLLYFLDPCISAQFVLSLEVSKGLDVLFERLDSAVHLIDQLCKCVPKPYVFIDKLSLLALFIYRLLGLLNWDSRGLDVLLGLVTEKSMKQDWLQLRNFLKTLNALLENFLNFFYYSLRSISELRYELALFRWDQV